MTALEQMQKAVAEDRTYHDVETIEVDVLDLRAIIDDVEHLRAKVTELQAAGTRLALERQNIDKDRFSIAEKVRTACAVECDKEVDAAVARALRSHGHPHWDREDGQKQGASWCVKHVLELDLAKVLGP